MVNDPRLPGETPPNPTPRPPTAALAGALPIEVVSGKGRRTTFLPHAIVAVLEADDPQDPPGVLLVTGVMFVVPGETYGSFTERLAAVRSGDATRWRSPVPVYGADGVRIFPDGTVDRSLTPSSKIVFG